MTKSSRWESVKLKLITAIAVLVALAAPQTRVVGSDVVNPAPRNRAVLEVAKQARRPPAAQVPTNRPPRRSGDDSTVPPCAGPNESQEGDALFGCELHLDIENYVGYALARDEVPQHLIDGALKTLTVFGWLRVEDAEAIEAHEFADGTTGVKIWLYRTGKPQALILRDVGMAA